MTNTIFTESQLDIKLNPLKILPYTMDTTEPSASVISTLQDDNTISQLREEFGADLVIIYRLKVPNDTCGIAYINDGRADYSFAHISIDCSDHYTAHEVGHTMGLYHSIKDAPDVGYPRGYGVEHEFSTIMTYESHYHAKHINKYSSPKLECYGYPCGIEVGEENEADAVKALELNAPIVAAFYPSKMGLSETLRQQAEEEYLYYKSQFDQATQQRQELYSTYATVAEQYESALTQSQKSIQSYYANKEAYLRLQHLYTKTKSKSIKEEAQQLYQNLSKSLQNSNFSTTYALLIQKNKLERAYQTYENTVYNPIKAEYEKAKCYYEQIQAL